MASRKTKRLLAILGLVAAALVIAAWVGWSWLARRGLAEIAVFEARQAERGVVIQHDALTIEGFPLKFVVTATNLKITGSAGWWAAPTASATVTITDPRTVHLAAPGPTQMDLAAGAFGPSPRKLTLEGVITGVAHVAEQRSGSASFTVDNPRLIPANASEVEARADRVILSGEWAEVPPGDLTHPGLTVATDVTNAVPWRDGKALPLGPFGGKVAAAIKGPIDPRATLAVWRDAGGVVDLQSVEVTAGTVRLSLNGTVSLDRELRPMGAASAVIRNPLGVIDAAITAGAIKAKDAFTIKLLLGGLMKPDPAGGPPALTVPISAQAGTLSVGPLALLRLPSLADR